MSVRPVPAPYVGPKPFEAADAGLFNGRDRETHELRSLLLSNRAVLLYGASGTGKTSLLAAGLLPRLAAGGADVLPLGRVARSAAAQAGPAAEGQYFTRALLASWQLAEPSEPADNGPILAAVSGREVRLDRYGDPVPVIGVMDQAEEIFTVGAHRAADRMALLADLREALDAVPNLHVLIGLREDFLAQYTRLVERSGFGSCGRFHLLPLLPKAAVEAVELPALSTSRRYAQGVASEVVDLLRTTTLVDEDGAEVTVVDEFVEPVQLQVVCERLWHSIPPDDDVITTEMVRSFGDVDQALGAFYDEAVDAVAAGTNIAASRIRRWIEETFITDVDTRGAVNEGRSMTRGMPNAVPKGLEDRHVLRAEDRARARWFELAHDRLIEVIRRSNRASLRTPEASRAQEAAVNLAWAEHLLGNEQYDEAQQCARIALEICESIGDRWAAANAVAFLGDIEASKGAERVERALEIYLDAGNRLRVIHDDHALARVLTARGGLLLDQERLAEAKAELEEAVALDPSNLDAAQQLASTLWYAGEPAQAIEAFTRALTIDPLSFAALNGRGQLLADLGQPREALADLDFLLGLGPDLLTEAYARSARALALEALGRSEEADRELASALSATPENAWAHLRRAKILTGRGQPHQAEDALQRALTSTNPALTNTQRAEATNLLAPPRGTATDA
ncbi:tetratricopeptide repeat protein [Kribbella sp. NBC_00382]|uniref:nSTAND1 domain-containing NTPase n=1 Tax=Kribbella sp. NBC_00382 TaxID=2975967 RepID=UPI002E23D858